MDKKVILAHCEVIIQSYLTSVTSCPFTLNPDKLSIKEDNWWIDPRLVVHKPRQKSNLLSSRWHVHWFTFKTEVLLVVIVISFPVYGLHQFDMEQELCMWLNMPEEERYQEIFCYSISRVTAMSSPCVFPWTLVCFCSNAGPFTTANVFSF